MPNKEYVTVTEEKSGTVRVWFGNRGFGFITPADGGVDVFVHHSEVRGLNLTAGDLVFFCIGANPKDASKVVATNLRLDHTEELVA